MSEKVILMDGAVGTSLWEKTDNKVPVWHYNIENPAIVSELHREYIAAGAQMLLCNTFGANRAAVAKSDYTVEQVVRAGVRLAKEAAEGTGVKVVFSAGPLSELLEPYGDLSEDEARGIYEEQIGAGMLEKPDIIFLQTFMDVEMLKIAQQVALRYDVPLFCAMSFDQTGHTMMGNTVPGIIEALTEQRVDAIGLNCSLGPDLAVPVLKTFRQNTDLPLVFKPNAGKPILVDGKSESGLSAEVFADDVLPAADIGATYIGGCCGTNPVYIRRLGEKLRERGRL